MTVNQERLLQLCQVFFVNGCVVIEVAQRLPSSLGESTAGVQIPIDIVNAVRSIIIPAVETVSKAFEAVSIAYLVSTICPINCCVASCFHSLFPVRESS